MRFIVNFFKRLKLKSELNKINNNILSLEFELGYGETRYKEADLRDSLSMYKEKQKEIESALEGLV